MAKYIEQEEMQRQEEYLQKLLEYTSEFSRMHGRVPLAHTETYGCQQNENDTERIRGILKKAGFSFCEQSETADLVIYNTCAVRECSANACQGIRQNQL